MVANGRTAHAEPAGMTIGMIRHDLACSYRLFPEVLGGRAGDVDVVTELHGRFGLDGSHEILLAPGLPLMVKRWMVEASIQLPAVQDLAGDGPQAGYRLVFSVRYQW